MELQPEREPEREPDLILPSEDVFVEVKVWISEGKFLINNYLCNYMVSSTLGLKEETDPMIYIDAVAKSEELNGYRRQEIAREFLAKLDSMLVGELDE